MLFEVASTALLSTRTYIGIPIALVGAVFLAFGAQLQHRGVNKVDAQKEGGEATALRIGQLFALLRRPSWLFGTLMLGLAVVLQLTALYFAPIIVVQPLGAVALVLTAIVNARVSGVKLTLPTIRSISFCIVGVAVFVTIAAFQAQEKEITERELSTVLILLLIITALFALAFVFFRHRFKAIIYIVGAGVLYGFVATLAKVVIGRIQTIITYGANGFEWLTIVCVIALIAATALGGYFVQTAYASGPPDLVIAGLTVIDPLVAVTIGIIVLREASNAEWWAIVAFIVAGALAVYGVFQLAKYHPQSQR
ncbi:DMT family transporter [Lacisediminihabitans sp. G11-30]|uniref:DMT family transporter n=1 Tax=Lacisediminihabitans changchengi TaxID=2787634 RepID=A0A934W194_9MICO|nr:DMT family transporter [Lacisediminihabitans changchengi]